MPKLLSLAATVAATSLLLLAAPALATPVTVNLRVEGPQSTIFEGPVTTDVHQVDAPDSQTQVVAPRDCDGVHDGGPPPNPYGYATPGPTPTSTLDSAATQAGFAWDRTWYAAYNEMFVNSVGGQPLSSTSYWTFLVNWKLDPNYGGCTSQVHQGDDVVWAAYDYGNPFLQLSGTPARVATNEPFTVTVQEQDGAGNATPSAGAGVGGQTTDAQGHATIAFADAGSHTLKASKAATVRSNAQTVCVYVPGSGDCGSDSAPAPGGQQPTDTAPTAAPAVKDTTPPQVGITTLRSGKTYKRGPRVLAGDVKDAGGIAQVFLRLRATRGGALTSASRCRWFSDKRGVFTHRAVPCSRTRFFRVGKSSHFSYLLPGHLRRGRYVVDVKVLDTSDNAGRTSVSFRVR